MKNILKYIGTLAVAACLGMGVAQAGTTIWGSTHRSVSATNRIPVDTGSSSSPGYNSTADVVDTMSGDCTSTAAAVTCTKTGGVSFGALATLDLSATGGASQVLQQTTVGGAVTVGQLATTNLSDILSDNANSNLFMSYLLPSSILTGTAFDDTAFGNQALVSITEGGGNTAIGTQVLYLASTGFNNTGVGDVALSGLTTGGKNTAIGVNALGSLTTGSQNTVLGDNANVSASNAQDRIAIGYNAVASADNTVQIGTSGTGKPTDVYFGDNTAKLHADGSLLTAVNAATVDTISGLISQGTNITITGTGTALDPYVITASGSLGSSFDSISSGTNTTAAMVVDTGASIAASGSGTIAATTVTNGVYTTDTGSVTNTMLGGSIALSKLATQATNTVVGNATSGSAAPTALAVGTCSTAGSALNWTTNTGFGCNTSITAAAVPASGLTGATLSSSVTASSLVSTGTLTGGATGSGFTVALGSSTITGTLPAANNETNLRHTSIGATFNGGGSAIAANSKQWVYVPYGTTIQSVTIACDQTGSIVFGVQMDTYANFSTSMTSIVASAPPTVSSAQKSQDATLTGWTTAIPAGDYILFNVTSATTVTNCNIVLDTVRT